MTDTQRVTVAQFIANHIAFGKKSHAEIAKKLGYDSPAIIRKFEQGTMKVPINKAKALAKALDGDPVMFFEVLLKDYMPETWAAFREVLGEMALNEHEMAIVRAYRRLAADLGKGADINVAICPAETFFTVEQSRPLKTEDGGAGSP